MLASIVSPDPPVSRDLWPNQAPAGRFTLDGSDELEWHLSRSCEHDRLARPIPGAEATRLLMNSCSGLLFARTPLDEERFPDAVLEEVARTLARAQLAFGDVVLLAFGQHHWNCRERLRRLLLLDVSEELSWLQTVRRHHAQGVEFKLHPQCADHPLVALRSLHDELRALGLEIWLWLESRRLACPFPSARDYALSPVNKCPETGWGRNLLLNASALARGAWVSSRWHRHPRQRLLHALALLLWEPVLWADGESLHRVQKELGTTARTFPELVSAYRLFWQHFS